MTANSNERVALRLTSLPAYLSQNGYQPRLYRWIREGAIDGVFPAHQRNCIWHFYREDLAEIAAGLRLERTENVAA